MNSIEQNIVDKLLEVTNVLVADKIIGNDAKWTRDIKSALCEMGYEFGYSVYTSKANDHDNTTNEYLYDMMWFTPEEEKEKPWDLKIIHLALESEWNQSIDDIKYDFYKLVQARAQHRVMIFQAKDVLSVMMNLKNIINNSTISQIHDRYLLAGWNDDDGFTFDVVIKTN